VQQIAERDADQQRREQAAGGEQDAPVPPPPRRVPMAAVLHRDAAHDQRGQ
jgi:hypothetical protein